MLAAGSLNKRITLLAPATTQDAAGQPGPDVEVASCWAAIDSISGQNLYQLQFVSQSTHKVSIRYRPDVVPKMRVRYGTRIFSILYVGNERERNESLDLFCEEVL